MLSKNINPFRQILVVLLEALGAEAVDIDIGFAGDRIGSLLLLFQLFIASVLLSSGLLFADDFSELDAMS